MTSYTNIKVNISKGQKKKIVSAIKKGDCKVSIRLGHADLRGNDILAVMQTQAKKIAKASQNGTGVTIKLSSAQLKRNKEMKGGFLGMLAGLAASALPALAKTILPALGVGALSGLASSGVQKAIGSGLFLKKGGCVCRIGTDGKGLHLSPYKGKGLGNVEEKTDNPKYARLKTIMKNPRKVILEDVQTGEKHNFPSIYKAGKFIYHCPQTILNWEGRVWKDKYKINVL